MQTKGAVIVLIIFTISSLFMAGCNIKNKDEKYDSMHTTTEEKISESQETTKDKMIESQETTKDKMIESQETSIEEYNSNSDQRTDISVEERLANAEQLEKEQNKLLENSNITDIEMNEISSEIYRIWDEELNGIWAQLNLTLDTSTMDSLKEEQKKWIRYKEESMQTAGIQAEGGTMQQLLEKNEGGDLTKKRVYELSKLLK